MAPISIPTTSRLPSSLRIPPSNPTVARVLSRLSRPSLLSLALDWLDENNQSLSAPYLRPAEENEDEEEDEGDFYPPARSLDELRELYEDMQSRKGPKREALDRILEGDWRHGLSLYQLAMADLQYLHDHPASQKWSAYRILPLRLPSDPGADAEEPPEVDKTSLVVPRFHPSTFLQNLQAQVLPDVKAHYLFDRHKKLPLLLLRIFILDSPYNTDLAVLGSGSGGGAGEQRTSANFDVSRTVYLAFPDASPHIYISNAQTVGPGPGSGGPGGPGDARSLRSLVVEGVPKALSRPRQRYTLRSTNLSTRNLSELLLRRGAGRTNAAGGGWSIYAEKGLERSPLDFTLPTPPLSERSDEEAGTASSSSRKRPLSPDEEEELRRVKRRRLVAQERFGNSAKIDDGKGIERLDIVMQDPFPASSLSAREQPGQRDGDEGADDGEEEAPSQRRRTGKHRRSTIEAALAREAEAAEDDSIHSPGAQGRPPDDGGGGRAEWRPEVRLTFHGAHVFAGIRQLVEAGVIDGERMPGWMTGEEGVSIGAVRHGRIRGHKGSGM